MAALAAEGVDPFAELEKLQNRLRKAREDAEAGGIETIEDVADALKLAEGHRAWEKMRKAREHRLDGKQASSYPMKIVDDREWKRLLGVVEIAEQKTAEVLQRKEDCERRVADLIAEKLLEVNALLGRVVRMEASGAGDGDAEEAKAAAACRSARARLEKLCQEELPQLQVQVVGTLDVAFSSAVEDVRLPPHAFAILQEAADLVTAAEALEAPLLERRKRAEVEAVPDLVVSHRDLIPEPHDEEAEDGATKGARTAEELRMEARAAREEVLAMRLDAQRSREAFSSAEAALAKRAYADAEASARNDFNEKLREEHGEFAAARAEMESRAAKKVDRLEGEMSEHRQAFHAEVLELQQEFEEERRQEHERHSREQTSFQEARDSDRAALSGELGTARLEQSQLEAKLHALQTTTVPTLESELAEARLHSEEQAQLETKLHALETTTVPTLESELADARLHSEEQAQLEAKLHALQTTTVPTLETELAEARLHSEESLRSTSTAEQAAGQWEAERRLLQEKLCAVEQGAEEATEQVAKRIEERGAVRVRKAESNEREAKEQLLALRADRTKERQESEQQVHRLRLEMQEAEQREMALERLRETTERLRRTAERSSARSLEELGARLQAVQRLEARCGELEDARSAAISAELESRHAHQALEATSASRQEAADKWGRELSKKLREVESHVEQEERCVMEAKKEASEAHRVLEHMQRLMKQEKLAELHTQSTNSPKEMLSELHIQSTSSPKVVPLKKKTERSSVPTLTRGSMWDDGDLGSTGGAEPHRGSIADALDAMASPGADAGASMMKVGDRVTLLPGKNVFGVVRFIGKTKFAAGDWLGLELEEPQGKNDGCVNGHRYFQCAAMHGLFIRTNKVVRVGEGEDPDRPNCLQFMVQLKGLRYERVVARPLLVAGMEAALRALVASESGGGVSPQHVEAVMLPGGSMQVSVLPPSDVAIHSVEAKLSNSTSLEGSIEAILMSVPGFQVANVGRPAHATISGMVVQNLAIPPQAPEVVPPLASVFADVGQPARR